MTKKTSFFALAATGLVFFTAAHAQTVTGTVSGAPSAPAGALIQITPQALPDGTAGIPYAQTLTVVASESGPFYWMVNGTLPAGLSLDPDGAGVTAELTGTPTTVGEGTFSVSVTNHDVAVTQTYFFNIDPGTPGDASYTPPPQTIPPVAIQSSDTTLESQLDAIAVALQLLQSGVGNGGQTQGLVLGASTTGSGTATPVFYRDLTIGDTGSDVMALQQFLNNAGFPVALSGPGAPGYETEYFGPATQAALAKWQAAAGITPAAGYFGAITRNQINTLALPLR